LEAAPAGAGDLAGFGEAARGVERFDVTDPLLLAESLRTGSLPACASTTMASEAAADRRPLLRGSAGAVAAAIVGGGAA